tara:strand:+ start:157 stop:357 length:201 start_codon:yes stop_codon:yes gene_type:complete
LICCIGFVIGATLVNWSIGPMVLTKSSNKFINKNYWKNLKNAISSSPAFKGLIGALTFSRLLGVKK